MLYRGLGDKLIVTVVFLNFFRSVPYDKKNTQQIYPCQFDQPIQKETRWYRLHTCLDPSSHGYYDDHPEEDVKAEKKALLKKMQEEKAAKRR